MNGSTLSFQAQAEQRAKDIKKKEKLMKREIDE